MDKNESNQPNVEIKEPFDVYYVELLKLIRKKMVSQKITQKELSDKTKIKTSTLSTYTLSTTYKNKGDTIPPIFKVDTMFKICHELDIKPHELPLFRLNPKSDDNETYKETTVEKNVKQAVKKEDKLLRPLYPLDIKERDAISKKMLEHFETDFETDYEKTNKNNTEKSLPKDSHYNYIRRIDTHYRTNRYQVEMSAQSFESTNLYSLFYKKSLESHQSINELIRRVEPTLDAISDDSYYLTQTITRYRENGEYLSYDIPLLSSTTHGDSGFLTPYYKGNLTYLDATRNALHELPRGIGLAFLYDLPFHRYQKNTFISALKHLSKRHSTIDASSLINSMSISEKTGFKDVYLSLKPIQTRVTRATGEQCNKISIHFVRLFIEMCDRYLRQIYEELGDKAPSKLLREMYDIYLISIDGKESVEKLNSKNPLFENITPSTLPLYSVYLSMTDDQKKDYTDDQVLIMLEAFDMIKESKDFSEYGEQFFFVESSVHGLLPFPSDKKFNAYLSKVKAKRVRAQKRASEKAIKSDWIHLLELLGGKKGDALDHSLSDQEKQKLIIFRQYIAMQIDRFLYAELGICRGNNKLTPETRILLDAFSSEYLRFFACECKLKLCANFIHENFASHERIYANFDIKDYSDKRFVLPKI